VVENPIQLFGTRADRYPEPSDTDIAQGAAKVALAAIPVVGGPIIEVLSMVLTPSVTRRRDQWFRELADGLDHLEKKVEGFRVQELHNNEVAVSAIIQATRTAVSTHQEEKRRALRNAVLNIILSKSSDEERQQVFLNLIEVLSVTHLEILKLFANPIAFPTVRRDELRQQRSLTDPMVIDLNDRGLLVDPRQYVARMRESSDSLAQAQWTLSPLGKEFLLFIAMPEQLT
jgi:hypothetical protein